MIKPANGTMRDLQTLLYSKVDAQVGNNDVATLCECRDYEMYCREPLGVENRGSLLYRAQGPCGHLQGEIVHDEKEVESKTDTPMVP